MLSQSLVTSVVRFFFQKSVFLKLLSALCADLYEFFPCVRIFSSVGIRPLFSVLLLPKVPIVLTKALNKKLGCLCQDTDSKREYVFNYSER